MDDHKKNRLGGKGYAGLSRRQLLQTSLVLGLGLTVASLGGFGIHEAFAAGEEYGGTLNLRTSGNPSNFDPLANGSGNVLAIIGPAYNGIMQYDPADASKLIGDLAESWELSSDGLTYTFNLVQNAKFHDGVPMTSADVKYTFDVMRDPPDGQVSRRKSLLQVIDRIEAPDDYTVRFVLKRPGPGFLETLSGGWMLVLPKHILEKGPMTDVIIGTGPFMFKEQKAGVSYELVKNPDYFVEGRPFLDGVTAFVIPDRGTTMSALQNGQLGLYGSMTAGEAADMSDSDAVTSLTTNSTSFSGVTFNIERAPFDNVLVRKALALAIDRDDALALIKGAGVLGGAVMPSRWALSDAEKAGIPGYGPDGSANLEEAKRLLAEAGFPDGFAVTLTVRRINRFVAEGIFLKDQWSKIGIDVTLDNQESAMYFATTGERNFDVVVSGGSMASADPDNVGPYYACGGSKNLSQYCDPETDDLIERVSGELDTEERLRLAHQLDRRVTEQYAIYPLYWRNRFMGVNNTFHCMVLHSNNDNNMKMQNVWISK